MNTITPTQQSRVFLARWDIWLTVIFTEQGAYFVLSELCDALGVADHHYQRRQLQAHESATSYVEKLPYRTETRGVQRAYCLHQDILAGWLFMLNPGRIRQEFRPTLVDFQREAIQALKRVLFGEVNAPVSEQPQANIIKLSDWLGKPRDKIQLSPPSDDDE